MEPGMVLWEHFGGFLENDKETFLGCQGRGRWELWFQTDGDPKLYNEEARYRKVPHTLSAPFPEQNNVRKRGIISAHSWGSSPSQWGNHRGRSWSRQAIRYPPSGSREMKARAQLTSPSYSVQDAFMHSFIYWTVRSQCAVLTDRRQAMCLMENVKMRKLLHALHFYLMGWLGDSCDPVWKYFENN